MFDAKNIKIRLVTTITSAKAYFVTSLRLTADPVYEESWGLAKF